MSSENFSVYGLRITIHDDWRVEISPKNTREKTDVAFHTPRGNKFFVSWGKLDDATRRFPSLRDHRDENVKKIQSGKVPKAFVSDSRDEIVNGHNAIFSRVTAEINTGMLSKKIQEKDMWSAHFYCPESSRYYVVFCNLSDPSEYEDIGSTFANMAKSAVCH